MPHQEPPKKLGRYEVVRELGKGAMGVVYEGLDPNIGRRVAIKTARRDVMEASGMADEMMERFLREAQAAGALSHPNIITIYDAGEEDGIAYIAMEYLEGNDLQAVVKAHKRFAVEKVVEICATIAEALGHAHQAGTVHRDVKPANIMMPDNGPLKVTDFGIAHVSDSNLTQSGAMIGTPHYMSPEQFMGHRVDGRTDIFSLGIILYELLTGEKPFTGDSLSAVMNRVLRTKPLPPKELNFAVNEYLDAVVMKALSKEPAKRYQSGEAMAAALRESLKENPDPAILGATPREDAATVITDAATEATAVEQRPDATIPEALPADETAVAEPETPETTAATARLPAQKEARRPAQKKRLAWFVLAAASVLVGLLIVIAIVLVGNSGPADFYGQVSFNVYPAEEETAPEQWTLTIEDPESGAKHVRTVNGEQGLFDLADCREFTGLKPRLLNGYLEADGYLDANASALPVEKGLGAQTAHLEFSVKRE